MQSSNDGDTPPADMSTGDPEAWGFWETGLVLCSIAVGTTGLVVLGWAVERFILT